MIINTYIMFSYPSFIRLLLFIGLQYYCLKEVRALLLSDLPTPSFIVDIDALRFSPQIIDDVKSRPTLYLPKFNKSLLPRSLIIGENQNDVDIDPTKSFFQLNQERNKDIAIGYLHTSVIRAREETNEKEDKPIHTFLAEVDLTQSLCCSQDKSNLEKKSKEQLLFQKAQLVLGLNNHHVGSYYWARSAGAGASMEAPGVSFKPSFIGDDRGILRWEAIGGPLECNSNDGKRSEWVNFLRIGDNIQFLPNCDEEAIMAFVNRFEVRSRDESRIYGISAKGRPLGSEPMVVCKWFLE